MDFFVGIKSGKEDKEVAMATLPNPLCIIKPASIMKMNHLVNQSQ